MSSGIEVELFKQFKAAQEKYIYFLLAAAASAIGFAMTQSKTEALTLYHIPLGLSDLCWTVSFYSGLQFLAYAISTTFQNLNHLAFKRELSKQAQEKQTVSLAKEMKERYRDTTGKQERRMEIYGKLQNTALLLGAILYIAWHILRMYRFGV